MKISPHTRFKNLEEKTKRVGKSLPLKIFKTLLLRRDFHTLIKRVSFSSPTKVGFYNDNPSNLDYYLQTTRLG